MSGEPGKFGTRKGDLALDELAALNDEIVALVRAGLPLEVGLAGAGGDLSGRLGRLSAALAERLQRGEDLASALAAEGDAIPPLYQAVVAAGLRSGHPTAALEGLAGYVRRYTETRRVLGLALIYPAAVILLAWVLFVGFTVVVAPRIMAVFDDLRVPGREVAAALAWLGERAGFWAPVLPVVLLILALFWRRSGRSGAFAEGRPVPLGWVPWLGEMLRQARVADFADLLALLAEGNAPLPDSVVLAADATGDPTLRRDARALADALRRGEPLGDTLSGERRANGLRGGFPPLLRWLLAVGERQGALAPALRHAADVYRRRALQRAELIRAVVPTLLVVAVGVSVVFLYALTLFVPFTQLLEGLTLPT